ncbi:MAG: polysaccharide pyruvyl transferase family protein [Gelidibacter sp.]
MKKIFVYCACDRLNYGDLLFPLIIQKVFSAECKYEIEIIGTTKSDLTQYGALKSKSYKELWNKRQNTDKDFLIIAGGEVLETEWSSTLSFLSSTYYNLYHRLPFKTFLNTFAQKYIGNINEILPFVPSSKELMGNYHLIFNAVGGNEVSTNRYSKIIEKSLENSIYASFRNESIFNDIETHFSQVKPILSPDSALIMSDIFTHIQSKKNNDYIIFQVGYFKSMNKLELIAKQLNDLQIITNLEILLMPIGFCSGHDDLKALKIIKGYINNPQINLRIEKNIFLLMELIAGAKLFIGTSLHGVITAMSYNIPYVGLNPSIRKLENYLETWGVEGLDTCTEYEKITNNAIDALKTDKEILIKNSQTQKNIVYQSFNDIIKLINQY